MATVNLGRIKPVFRGAYDNSTAYVIDDIVTSGNETFIAIALLKVMLQVMQVSGPNL